MTAIPTILRDAGWPAYLAAVAALAATLRIAQGRRRRAAEARIAAALAAPVVDASAWRDGAEVTIRGVLRAERPAVSVAALGFAGGREQCELTHDALDGAAVEVDGEAVALGEPVAVEVGSHVVRHHELPAERFEAACVARDRYRRATELHVFRGGVESYHVRRIAPGDEVRARGRLVRGDGGWRLEPAGRAVALVATRAVVDPLQLPPQTSVGRAVIAAAVAFVGVALAAHLLAHLLAHR